MKPGDLLVVTSTMPVIKLDHIANSLYKGTILLVISTHTVKT